MELWAGLFLEELFLAELLAELLAEFLAEFLADSFLGEPLVLRAAALIL